MGSRKFILHCHQFRDKTM
ncbi:unnamed protein product [Spirodela intermedia]|uniref:Uncharacterized protein n=1 Tax=Spirodela intermedia TaxID=51605 RepID=A0A7I8IW20_SPIIN|nr:unnamed protein product [Spirodela intermedia]CAA6661853.1 unnamed protein product [Spirodela intermedia]